MNHPDTVKDFVIENLNEKSVYEISINVSYIDQTSSESIVVLMELDRLIDRLQKILSQNLMMLLAVSTLISLISFGFTFFLSSISFTFHYFSLIRNFLFLRNSKKRLFLSS